MSSTKLSVIQCCLISCESRQEEDIVISQSPQAPQTFKVSLVALRTKSNFQYSPDIASGYQIISQYLHQMTMQPYGSQLLVQLVLSSHIRTPRDLTDPITAAPLHPHSTLSPTLRFSLHLFIDRILILLISPRPHHQFNFLPSLTLYVLYL